MKTTNLSAIVFVAVLLLSSSAFAAWTHQAENLPASEYADTEVSTNFPVSIRYDNMRVDFAVSLAATPTNNVEVSIGSDVNADGNLSPEEASYTFGYDCGKWFVRDAATDSEQFQVASADSRTGRAEKSFTLLHKKVSLDWNLVKVTRRGFGSVGEFVESKGYRYGMRLIVK